MAIDLVGKHVLITGAAGGVGHAVTARFVEAGAKVLATDRDAARLDAMVGALAVVGDNLVAVAADLGQPAGLETVFSRLDVLGGIDILVACAGVGSGPLMEMEGAAWRAVIDTNLVSYVACTQAAVDRMKSAANKEGMVILVGSISVHIKAVGESVYNASKGGVASFAETLRKELIDDEIRVTLIEPGAIASAMQPYSAQERAAQVAEFMMLSPAEVAEAIIFAATRPRGVDVVTLRIEPLRQKIF